jgi:hypothetical protein
MTPSSPKMKRYNLVLPEELFNEIKILSEKQHTTVVEILRRFIRLGLLATQIEEIPDAALLIREGDNERQIIFL